MKYKAYSKNIWDQINKALDEVLQLESRPVAAFDADGTLWDTDLGETFFDYIIEQELVELPENPWEYYESLKKESAGPQKAYLWLAQILKGHEVSQVRRWAQASASTLDPLPYFEEQKKIVDLFKSKGVEIYIVTASIKWAVEPGAEMIGLDADQVLGIETLIENNRLTDLQKGVITYREGKAKALLERTQNRKPFFVSGNTFGDRELLEASTHVKLAVMSTQPDDRLFKSELELQHLAEKSNWLKHRFT